MIKVFLDTSVILSACMSKAGGSSYVLMLCRSEKITGFISRYVIYEAKKTSTTLLSGLEKQRLNFLLLQCKLKIADEPLDKNIQKYYPLIEKKDAPIIATAQSSHVDYLITLNTKDFMQKKLKSKVSPLEIVTPKDFIAINKDAIPS